MHTGVANPFPGGRCPLTVHCGQERPNDTSEREVAAAAAAMPGTFAFRSASRTDFFPCFARCCASGMVARCRLHDVRQWQ
jgi:hypothetical protein